MAGTAGEEAKEGFRIGLFATCVLVFRLLAAGSPEQAFDCGDLSSWSATQGPPRVLAEDSATPQPATRRPHSLAASAKGT